MSLEDYRKLRKELMGEGLIDANERYLMKGFKIKINGKSLSIGVNDIGVSSIFINCMDGECHISVRGVDHVTGTRYVWVEEQIEFGQRIEFDFTDIDSESIPLIESDAEVMNIDDIKLESYYRIKKLLEEEGVL